MGKAMAYKNLPSITECDSFLRRQNLAYGKSVREIVNSVLNQVRQEIYQKQTGSVSYNNTQILERVAAKVRIQSTGAQRVINATGVVVHTNLGRAPLSAELLANALPRMSSYSTWNMILALESVVHETQKSASCYVHFPVLKMQWWSITMLLPFF